MTEENQQLQESLKCEPVEIKPNEYYNPSRTPITHVANLNDTNMIDCYHGAGEGYAYVKEGKVVGFYYEDSIESPIENKPANAKRVAVNFSGTQICFIGNPCY